MRTGTNLIPHSLVHGTTKSALGLQLGVSFDTYYRWLRFGELDRGVEERRYSPQQPVAATPDGYAAVV